MTLLRFKNIKLQSYKPGKSLLAGNKNIIKLSANESALVSVKMSKKLLSLNLIYQNIQTVNFRN